jgi:hypothetical protein
MPSLDFIYDLTEKLDEEKDLNYLVLSIREGSTEDKVDVFFRINPECEEVFTKAIEQIKEVVTTRNDKQNVNKPKPKPKRKRKKKE